MATRRRGHGEGSIYFRADKDRWVGSIDLGWQDGRRVRRSYYGRTRHEVRDRLRLALREAQEGVQPGTRRDTVAAYLAGWLDAMEGTVRSSTLRRYRQIVTHQLAPYLGRLPLSGLTPADVEAMLRRLSDAELSPRSVHHARAVLRSALAGAVRHGQVSRNVAALAKGPRLEHREIRTLSPDQVRAFLIAVRGHRHEALFTVAVATGMRQGELLGLRWSDVDPIAGTLTVRHALQWVDREARLVEPKTARSRRTVPLPEVAQQALAALPRDSVYVFANDAGGPLHPGTVYHALQAALAAGGLPRVSFHALRHSYASLLIAQGVHPRVIMEALGHSQISLTMNTYGHVIPALEREAAERMDALLSS
jgi:integrase